METKRLLRLTAIFTIIFLLLFVFILLRVDPFTSGRSALIAFLIFLFFSLSGLLTFPGFYLRTVVDKEKTPLSNFNISLRQSILISIGIVGLLILKSTETLTWWDGILLIGALVFLEMFFRS